MAKQAVVARPYAGSTPAEETIIMEERTREFIEALITNKAKVFEVELVYCVHGVLCCLESECHPLGRCDSLPVHLSSLYKENGYPVMFHD